MRSAPCPKNAPWRSLGLLAIANLLIPIAIWIFATGFFPYKPYLPGQNRQYGVTDDGALRVPFDKVVFMVIDALRSDFVYSKESGFQFVQSLIRSGAAIPFTAHAAPPTITMPRIKAMTTGSVPSFLDAILNFAESDTSSTLRDQDTWVSQLQSRANGHLLMYGDDTWLKLFPSTFSRADGTTSFFVSDFTEVDNNVTRHVPDEMKQSDWNGLVMHFLGVDHIGHKSGPSSPHMLPKQNEMDEVVRTIYEAIESQDYLASTLIVLCGDHGMNDAGNHGGSTTGETSPALVFLSPKLQETYKGVVSPVEDLHEDFQYYTTVEQSDIVPTMAILLGLPIPLNNLGVFIPRFLDLWPSDVDRIRILQQNADQVLGVVAATFSSIDFSSDARAEDCTHPMSDGTHLHCQWTKVERIGADKSADSKVHIAVLLEFLRDSRGILSSAASDYNVANLQLGIAISAVSLLFGLLSKHSTNTFSVSTTVWTSAIAIAYGSTMFASSYVEEEHHFWYWINCGWTVWLYIIKACRDGGSSRDHPLHILALGVLSRVLRRWNQTGQKHAGEPDIGRSYLPAHTALLWSLVAITYLSTLRALIRDGSWMAPSKGLSLLSILLVGAAALFKLSFTYADAPELIGHACTAPLQVIQRISLAWQARIVFTGLFLCSGSTVLQNLRQKSNAHHARAWYLRDLLDILLVTQTRVNNVPLLLLFRLQTWLLRRMELELDEIAMTSLIFQHASYFAHGGSNAISSIDLSNAYNGVVDYNVVAVGVLTFIGNWAGPIWWTLTFRVLMAEGTGSRKWQALMEQSCFSTLFVSSALTATMLACSMLRTHLFVWTVFSPKYLFSIAWSLGQHLLVHHILGSFIVWAV